ncbi:autotransporter outer membrane beta-barrel domain-containing protein [Zophobihabitans entericus]|uniref:Autotransporter outer membrane beta-barrel domain-containing protein n=1 Tax=Zophobihabitans entericus TaxID=1635327 RepID=A0A6G9I936_9GAMM|nr:autotransporter outer membrane beta-barrel domain-containing protein [Zophobihabitans entericus]QIQ20234.1 autotransporter outer membrane beta-barrel domain-containing protein [Zophobihabitans entericus]
MKYQKKRSPLAIAIFAILYSIPSHAAVVVHDNNDTLDSIVVAGADVHSIQDNGSITVANEGQAKINDSVVHVRQGQLDLGSGSKIYATEMGTNYLYGLRSGFNNLITSVQADNLYVSLESSNNGVMRGSGYVSTVAAVSSGNVTSNHVTLTGLTENELNVEDMYIAMAYYVRDNAASAAVVPSDKVTLTVEDSLINLTAKNVTYAQAIIAYSGEINLLGSTELNIIGEDAVTAFYGVGINKGGKFKSEGDFLLTIHAKDNATEAVGIEAYNKGSIELNNTDITIQMDKNVNNVAGLVSALNSSLVTNGKTYIDFVSSDDQFSSNTYYVQASNNSSITLNGDTFLGHDRENNAITAMTADNNSSITLQNARLVAYGNFLASSSGIIDIAANSASYLKGAATNNGGTINFDLSGNSVWEMMGDSSVTELSLNNSSLIYNHDDGIFKTLTVTTDYHGDGAKITLNTVLGDDTSDSDKLVITGDTSGTTAVKINNIGGTGAQTQNGIEIIEVQGQSDGEFTKSGRIIAGAYEYDITRGDGVATSSNNWYLTSGDLQNPNFRPEVGSYLTNLVASNTMFNLTFNDRAGERQYVDIATGDVRTTTFWLNQRAGRNSYLSGSEQLKNRSNYLVTQMGVEAAHFTLAKKYTLHLGLMAGYGYTRSHTDSKLTGYRSTGTSDGYSLGIYGYWFANDEEKTGLYIDSWFNYAWTDNKVSGEGLMTETYKIRGLNMSLESGYVFKLDQSDSDFKYYIQPNAQVIWMHARPEGHIEENGTVISYDHDNTVEGRLGMRFMMEGLYNDIAYKPFVETNYIMRSTNFSFNMDDITVEQNGSRHQFQLKAGINGQFNDNFSAWLNLSHNIGSHDYKDSRVLLGLKYAF